MRSSMRAICRLGLLGAVLAGCHGTPPQVTPTPAAPVASSFTGILRDSLVARIAGMEVDRAVLLATFAPGSPPVQQMDRQLATLQERLAALPRTPDAERLATLRVLRAFDERLAGLSIDHSVLLASFTAESPQVRGLAATVESLERRRAEIRGGGVSVKCTESASSPEVACAR